MTSFTANSALCHCIYLARYLLPGRQINNLEALRADREQLQAISHSEEFLTQFPSTGQCFGSPVTMTSVDELFKVSISSQPHLGN